MVEDERPVGEEQGGVGRVGLVGVGAPGLRLQLVAQIADIAEVELEGQARRRRHLPGAQLVVQVVEELLPNPLGGPVGSPDDDLAVSDAVGDMLGERTVAVPHDREARQPVDHRAAVEPEGLVAAGEEGGVGRQRLGVDVEVLHVQVVAGMLRFGGARRGEGRCRPVRGEGEEVGQQLVAVGAADRLGMELHAPQRQVAVAHAHHDPVVGPGQLLECRPEAT